jgi:hypothetical protein
MNRILSSTALMLAVTTSVVAGPRGAASAVRLTNSHLVAICMDGKAVAKETRKWDLTAPVVLTLSMRNEPRPGVDNAAPGLAVITFTPEHGHRYEVEVRASITANAERVWRRGQWSPVVRDRTSDRIVSGEPQWLDGAPCIDR